MLINMTHKLVDPEVRELISYSVFPDPDELEKVINEYQSEPALTLYGYEEENTLIGLIGVYDDGDEQLQIKHIAVQPENRLKGYGRGLILELIEHSKPASIKAETDIEAVDFYRSIGFSIFSLGELYPGIERFHCVYDVDTETDVE